MVVKKDSDILHSKGEQRFQSGRLYSMLDIMGPSITCDVCGNWQRIDALLEDDAWRKAEAKGWKRDDTGHARCPECAKGL